MKTPEELNKIALSNIDAEKQKRLDSDITVINKMLEQAAENGCNTIRVVHSWDSRVIESFINRGFTVTDLMVEGFVMKSITFKKVHEPEKLWLGELPYTIKPYKTTLTDKQ